MPVHHRCQVRQRRCPRDGRGCGTTAPRCVLRDVRGPRGFGIGARIPGCNGRTPEPTPRRPASRTPLPRVLVTRRVHHGHAVCISPRHGIYRSKGRLLAPLAARRSIADLVDRLSDHPLLTRPRSPSDPSTVGSATTSEPRPRIAFRPRRRVRPGGRAGEAEIGAFTAPRLSVGAARSRSRARAACTGRDGPRARSGSRSGGSADGRAR